MQFKQLNNIVGWAIFAIAAIVYIASAEPTGSLWDCGEFIAGAYKLQVVHPPGAPLYILIGRMFTVVAETIAPNNPAAIAHSVNIMSGLCTAFCVLFVFWSTTIFARLTLVGRGGELNKAQTVAALGAGAVAGLATTFATSIWFSAVEGEVYAMSTFFTGLVLWATVKWYGMKDSKYADRWLIFGVYMAGLSMGVHLLSLLVFPVMALLFYFKKFEKITWRGILISAAAGTGVLALVQAIIILRLPKVGAGFEMLFVNTFGLPFSSGLLFFIVLLVGSTVYGIYYAHKNHKPILQRSLVSFAMILVGFSTYAVVLIRANANPPINMNNPSDVFSLVRYLNREQYGDRPLLRGAHYKATPIGSTTEDRYAPVGDKYEVVDQKVTYKYRDEDMMFLPRAIHYDKRPQHDVWVKALTGRDNVSEPPAGYNVRFMARYQIGWMYWRYFMWNFVGRQNGEQGFHPWDSRNGHWLSGIKAIDSAHTYNQDKLPEYIANNQARNKYFFLPLIFGLMGIFYMFSKNRNDALAILALFMISGLGIIIQSNQPPNEPRERDYVLVGSFIAYAMWMGMGVLAMFQLFSKRFNLKGVAGAGLAAALVLVAPIIMGFQNWDDHNRGSHTGARDYAINFLESCEENAIIFTHGDNDTYPLWYAQEVENIRTDVRVVNLSLLAVDWYINQLRRKVNESPAIELSLPPESYRGYLRNQVMWPNQDDPRVPAWSSIDKVVKWIGEDHPLPTQGGGTTESYIPTKRMTIPVDKNKVLTNGMVNISDSARVLDEIRFTLNANRLIKDEIVLLDIIASNNWERPIYFAVTCKPEKTLGLKDYLQLEGMSLKLVPIKSQSDGRYGFVGSGRIAIDKTYENIMTKFKWGNFDKERLFVDRSYYPSVVSTRLAMIRLSRALIARGQNDRAVEVLNKYFEAYPNMNFPYDYNAMYLIQEYFNAGQPEAAKEHIRILAKNTIESIVFYESLNQEDRIDFQFEEQQANGVRGQLQQLMQQMDAEFQNEINAILQVPG